MAQPLKRSNAPIFWLLFGAGGTLAALIGPMLVFLTGIGAPLDLVPDGLLGYTKALALAKHWLGKAFLFAVVTLFLWHAMHRIFHTLHDFGVHTGTTVKILCYGTTLAATVIAAWALLAVGF
jgi:succinate dehydrogenase subunit D